MTRKTLRLKSPTIATIGALAFIGAAAAGGTSTFTADTVAKKGDRFQIVSEELCSGQAWPNISAECVAWTNSAPDAKSVVRFITVQKSTPEHNFTELERVRVTTAGQ